MAELDLDALEQAAREAGGGCWFSAGWTVGSRGFEVGDLKSRDRICSDATERCAEFIAAANPAAITELLDRLEAAEADALEQSRLNGMGSEREAALMAKLEAAEKERDFAKTEIARLHDDIRELTDVRVLDEEDRDRIVAWLQGTSTKPAQSVPECPYPCGWQNLLKHAIEDGAYLARSINEDEPVTENARSVTMRMVMRLRDVLIAINRAAPEKSK